MTPREFYEKVKQMRAAQKEYFKTRDSGPLARSKMLEHEIDEEIKRVEALLAQNPAEEKGNELIQKFSNRGVELRKV